MGLVNCDELNKITTVWLLFVAHGQNIPRKRRDKKVKTTRMIRMAGRRRSKKRPTPTFHAFLLSLLIPPFCLPSLFSHISSQYNEYVYLPTTYTLYYSPPKS